MEISGNKRKNYNYNDSSAGGACEFAQRIPSDLLLAVTLDFALTLTAIYADKQWPRDMHTEHCLSLLLPDGYKYEQLRKRVLFARYFA